MAKKKQPNFDRMVLTDKPIRMTWPNYYYLRSLVEHQQEVLERNYHVALSFIPSEKFDPKRESGSDKAHRIFSDEYAKLNQIKDELHAAAASTYKDHPRKEMRQFWELE